MAEITVAEYRRMEADRMLEQGRHGLQDRVRQRVVKLGLYDLYYHTWNARKSNPGYPDVHILIPNPGGLLTRMRDVYMELKRQDERKYQPSDDQIKWLDALSAIPTNEVYLLRPLDLLDGTIDHLLTVGALPDRRWRPLLADDA